MRVFKVLDNKSIIKADSRLFWTLFFKYDSLIIIWGKMGVFKVSDDKSILNAENG